MMTDETEDPLAELREARELVHWRRGIEAECRAQCEELRVAYLALSADARAQLAVCEADTLLSEEELRQATLVVYDTTGNRTPIAGIGIRLMTRFTYTPELALAWAVKHSIKAALALNRAGFEKIARVAPADVPFVTITKEYQVTIAADLGAVIAADKALEMEAGS